jgi:hypothetical protein
MVFNDGQTENTLSISFTNNNFFGSAQPSQETTILFNPETPIHIWFVVDVMQASGTAVRSWALTSYDAFHDPKVALTMSPGPENWHIERDESLTGNPLNDSLKGWKLTPTTEVPLLPGQSLLLTLSGLKTGLADGPTSGYCQVEMPNMDGYGDEAESLYKHIGPIIKTKTIIANDRVGIGTGQPGSSLDVNGAVRARGGDPGNYGSGNHGFFFNHEGDTDSGMTSLKDGQVAFYANNVKAMEIQEKDVTTSEGIDRQIEATIFGDLHIAKGTQGVSGGKITVGDLKSQGKIQDKYGDIVPVGTVLSFIGRNIPEGWLECVGQGCPYYTQETKERYGNLYKVLGDPKLFKDGNNNDHFRIPNEARHRSFGSHQTSLPERLATRTRTLRLRPSRSTSSVRSPTRVPFFVSGSTIMTFEM